MSKKTTDAEKKYSSYELEALAVIELVIFDFCCSFFSSVSVCSIAVSSGDQPESRNAEIVVPDWRHPRHSRRALADLRRTRLTF
ncbi:hypothetical protein AVEN_167466-1 [Araneus ventricosus]|uniref:Reverse transcriptase/retrotransposon-derived protein RNase H-like domain-containing protein n=1 Tax=Araneus ventricosus TaxID=182803 RepID=A0A4Y2IDI1_ARAVE|nr:hypothetical protein AVEN_167466-1 [Araneus ventricosus]